jgi:protein TonB
MALFLSILALALFAGLLSFNMSWSNVVIAERNDLVFENKNKVYGAFRIRRDYNGILIFALLASTGLITLVSAGALFLNRTVIEKQVLVTIDPGVILPPVDAKPPVPLVPPPTLPPQPPIPPTVHTFAFQPAEITENDATPPHSQDELINVHIGSATTEGEDVDLPPTPPTLEIVAGNGEPTPICWAEKMPEFPGGEAAMLQFLQKNIRFPALCRDKGIEGKVNLRFIVDKNGNITDVTVQHGVLGCPEYEREAIRSVKIMPTWSPGKMNGKPVAVYFSLPVSFSFSQ